MLSQRQHRRHCTRYRAGIWRDKVLWMHAELLVVRRTASVKCSSPELQPGKIYGTVCASETLRSGAHGYWYHSGKGAGWSNLTIQVNGPGKHTRTSTDALSVTEAVAGRAASGRLLPDITHAQERARKAELRACRTATCMRDQICRGLQTWIVVMSAALQRKPVVPCHALAEPLGLVRAWLL